MDTSITQLGFGAWAVGGAGWGKVADRVVRLATVRAAVEEGIEFFDSAPTYGESEEILGEALKHIRDRVFIATKFGPGDDPAASLEQSLKRLGTEYVDLLQMHEPDEQFEQSLVALAQLQESGKVRNIGVCNFNARQLARAVEVAPVDALQAAYNLFDRQAEQRQLPMCLKQGLAFLAYRPLASGLLTDGFSAQTAEKLGYGDHRRQIWWFRGPELRRRLAVHAVLRELALATGRTVSGVAIAWLLAREGVTIVLAGASGPAQVKQNAVAVSHPLTEDELDIIETAVALVYRPGRATSEAVSAAAQWGPRERFIVERLDGKTPYDVIAAQWCDQHEKEISSAQVRQFADQLAEAGMLA